MKVIKSINSKISEKTDYCRACTWTKHVGASASGKKVGDTNFKLKQQP